MIYSDFPITFLTACILGLIYFVLCSSVVFIRFRTRTAIGHDSDKLLRSYRIQSNFIEYVPILLILMGLLENANIDTIYMLTFSITLIIARIIHPIGLWRGNTVNVYRRFGASLTILLLLVMSSMGLYSILFN